MLLHPNSGYDFTPHLEAAIACVKNPVGQNNTINIESTRIRPDALTDRPDYVVVDDPFFDRVDEVTISSADQYLRLIKQTLVALRPHRYGIMRLSQDEEDYMAELVSGHELKHGAVVRRRGNTRTQDLYGVRIIPAMDGDSLSLIPMQITVGPLRKVHIAESAAAPPEHKQHDMALVATLGYDPDDLETLQNIADSMPNVPEEWHLGFIENDEELLAMSAIARLL